MLHTYFYVGKAENYEKMKADSVCLRSPQFEHWVGRASNLQLDSNDVRLLYILEKHSEVPLMTV